MSPKLLHEIGCFLCWVWCAPGPLSGRSENESYVMWFHRLQPQLPHDAVPRGLGARCGMRMRVTCVCSGAL